MFSAHFAQLKWENQHLPPKNFLELLRILPSIQRSAFLADSMRVSTKSELECLTPPAGLKPTLFSKKYFDSLPLEPRLPRSYDKVRFACTTQLSAWQQEDPLPQSRKDIHLVCSCSSVKSAHMHVQGQHPWHGSCAALIVRMFTTNDNTHATPSQPPRATEGHTDRQSRQ